MRFWGNALFDVDADAEDMTRVQTSKSLDKKNAPLSAAALSRKNKKGDEDVPFRRKRKSARDEMRDMMMMIKMMMIFKGKNP